MPRPASDLIPEIVKAYAARRGLHVTALSMELGHGPNWIQRLFASGKENLIPYIRLAEIAGLTLDELVIVIEAGQAAALVRNLQRGESIYKLARDIKVSEGTLRNLLNNTGKLNALKSYVELARAIGCKVSDLVMPSDFTAMSA